MLDEIIQMDCQQIHLDLEIGHSCNAKNMGKYKHYTLKLVCSGRMTILLREADSAMNV